VKGTSLLMSEKASELSRAFDRSFADAPEVDTIVRDAFLAVRIGVDPFAIPISEIAGVFAGCKITPVPGGSRTLLGIAAFRRAILPVHDLGALFGYANTLTPRWLVIASKSAAALAFDRCEGHLRLSHDAIASPDSADASGPYVRGVARAPGGARPIVDISAVLDAIKGQLSERAVRKER
jgi:chemotaxis signal transduction protein